MAVLRVGSPWNSLRASVLFLPILFVTCQAFDAAAVDTLIREVQRCRASTNPAVAVTVVQDGQTLYARGFGVRSLTDNGEVNENTRFNIASVSKAFTATLLLKVMEEDGRYNLSTKVRDIVGGDFRFWDDIRTQEATVEDVLSHKLAIPSNNRLRFDLKLTRENLKDRFKYLESSDGFRTTYIYSNLLYGLATYMTQLIGKKRWENLITERIFQPLGMNRSTFAKEMDLRDPNANVAKGYNYHNNTLKLISPLMPYYWSELAGSGSVVSTAKDMANWLNFHLSQGMSPNGRRVMPSNTVAELYKARTAMASSVTSKFVRPRNPVSLTYEVYGMGFRRGYYRGYPLLGHSGSSFGYRSLLTLIPSRKTGVFVTMSGIDNSYALRGTLTSYLLDIALGEEPWLNTTTMCTFPAPWYTVSSRKGLPYEDGTRQALAHPISAYLGTYENPAYGTVEIRRWEDTSSGEDDGQESQAHFTMFYGFATWDLVQLPRDNSSSQSYEDFYGKGRNITRWIDYTPFRFYAPPKDSKVIVTITTPGLEKKIPPVFTRVGYKKSGVSVATQLSDVRFWHTICLAFVASLVLFRMDLTL